MRRLREEEQVDLVVVLSHLGFPQEVKRASEVVAVIVTSMEYVNIPVTPETVGYEDFSQFRELLDDPVRCPALVHCYTGGRAGGLLLAYLILDEGMPPEEAEGVAETVGPQKRCAEAGRPPLRKPCIGRQLACDVDGRDLDDRVYRTITRRSCTVWSTRTSQT